MTDNPWWCGLTWGFIAVLALLGPCGLFVCFYGLGDDKDILLFRVTNS